MSLRERLLALADDVIREYAHTGMSGREAVEKVALAAARMALEDAEQASNAVAVSESCVEDRTGYVADECCMMIRTLRDGLENYDHTCPAAVPCHATTGA